jgi:hypothetical protein
MGSRRERLVRSIARCDQQKANLRDEVLEMLYSKSDEDVEQLVYGLLKVKVMLKNGSVPEFLKPIIAIGLVEFDSIVTDWLLINDNCDFFGGEDE